MRAPAWSLLPLLVLGACSREEPVSIECPALIIPAIAVEVSDATDGRWIADSARGAVRDGEYVDSLVPYRFKDDKLSTLQAAGDRPGVYDVTVQHDGYVDWAVVGVEAKATTCSVETVTLSARMQRRRAGG